MRAIFVGIAAAVAAAFSAPAPPVPGEDFPGPPPMASIRVAALGRSFAAADVLWLRAIQIVGHPDAERARYPRLDEWIDSITALDPAFDYPYAFATVLLSTEDARLERVDRILARGEANAPNSFWFPLHRGFLAYFGMLDSKRAAAHYRRASTREGAPTYLASFAKRLDEEEGNCARMPQQLAMVASAQNSRDASALRNKAIPIIEHCVQAEWRAARSKFNLLGVTPTTIEAIVASGLVDPLPAISGLCWTLDPTVLPILEPCKGPP